MVFDVVKPYSPFVTPNLVVSKSHFTGSRLVTYHCGGNELFHCEWIYHEHLTWGPNFIIKDLPSVLILIIADQILNDSLCCSNTYNWCLCRFMGKLYILLLTFLITLFEICIILHEIYWIKSKSDKSIMKLGPGSFDWILGLGWYFDNSRKSTNREISHNNLNVKILVERL